VLEGGEGHAPHPGFLAGADRVLDPSPAAVAQLQGGDVGAVLVGDEGGVAVALCVEDLKLGTGVRALAAHDQPRALGPGGEVDAIGQLGDLGALALGPIAVNRALPGRLRCLEDRLAHPLVDLVATEKRVPASRQSWVKAWVRPHDPEKRRAWDRCVAGIEGFHPEHGIKDRDTALGKEPTDGFERASWTAQRSRLAEQQRTLQLQQARSASPELDNDMSIGM